MSKEKHTNYNKINTAIIGLGNIGMGYARVNKIISHAKAVKKNKCFNLVAAVDIQKAKRKRFESTYKVPSYNKIKFLSVHKIDCLIISTPESSHLNVVLNCLNLLNPKIILIEKAMGKDFLESKKIASICKKNNVKFLVNYQRNFNKKFNQINKYIGKKNIKGIFWYSKNFRVNCSHYINFILNLGIKDLKIKVINKSDFCLHNKFNKFYFIKNHTNNIDFNEFEMINNKYKIKSFDSFNDFEISTIEKSIFFENFYKYKNKVKLIESKSNNSQLEVIKYISDIFHKNIVIKKKYLKNFLSTSKILHKLKYLINANE